MNKNILLLLCLLTQATAFAQTRREKEYQLIKTDGSPVSEKYAYISEPIEEKALFGMNGKVGFLDLTGQVLLPPTFDYYTIKGNSQYSQGMLAPFNSEEKCALMNNRFEVITPYIYDSFKKRAHNLIVARKGEYLGILDTLGNELTPFIYDRVGYNDNGFLPVEKDGKVGVIYKNGKQVIPFTEVRHTFRLDRSTKEPGLISVVIDEKRGLIDSTGREVLPFIYEFIGDEYGVDLLHLVKKYKTFDSKAERGVADPKGNIILEPIYEEVKIFDKGIITMKDSMYYFFDLQGNLKLTSHRDIGPSIYSCIAIYGGHPVQFYDCEGNLLSPLEKKPSIPESKYWWPFTDKETGLKGYRDIATGEVLIPAQYEDVFHIYDIPRWLSFVTLKGKKGIIDIKGNVVIPIEHQDILSLDSERCILVKNKKKMLVDYQGNMLTGYDFNYIDTMGYGSTSRDSSSVHVVLPIYEVIKGNHCGIIDRNGKEFVPCIYDYRRDHNGNVTLFDVLSAGKIVVKKKGKYGLIDQHTGQVLAPCQYDELQEDNRRLGYIFVKKKAKWGVLDKTGKEILPCIYPHVPYVLKNGTIIVEDGEQKGVADLNGNIVIPIEYEEIDIYHGDILRVVK